MSQSTPSYKYLSPSEMVDLKAYPMVDLSTDPGREFALTCRDEYRQTGLCMLKGFIRPEALSLLAREANELAPRAYFCKSKHSPYLTEENNPEAAGADKLMESTFVGSVAYDYIADSSHLKRLYLWDALKDFIGFVLGKNQFHRFGDPLGACSINVFTDGGAHGWHFDESEYTVTLMLQAPNQGGKFEYVPQLRGSDGENETLRKVLKGSRQGVVELPFTAGTLLIFGGRQTLHRVTKVTGSSPRLVPVLCYSEQPDQVNSHQVRKLFWGRTGEENTVSHSL